MAAPAPQIPEEILARVRDGERVELPELHAAIVPLEDVRLLEELEDAEDLRLAREALAEGDGKTAIPFEELKAQMDAEP